MYYKEVINLTTEQFRKILGREVECSNDGSEWLTGKLRGVRTSRCDMDLWRAGIVALYNPVTVYTVEVDGETCEFSQIRPVRKFKEGDKVYAMRGDEGVVEGYTEGGRVCVKVNGITWFCDESALTLKPESFFGGFDLTIETSEGVMPGEMVWMDTDSLFIQEYCAPPIGVAIEKAPETHTAPAFEIGQPVTCPPCDEDSVPIGTVIGFGDDESDVRVQLWNSRDVFEFDENAIVPYEVKKFKEGDVVTPWGLGVLVGEVVEYTDSGHVIIEVEGTGKLAYAENQLEFYEEPEEDYIVVEASMDMTPEEKLEKVKEYAKKLGVDVNEIVGRKGCVGLVVRK